MASLRARHSRSCALQGTETPGPKTEREGIDGCTCKPSYSIRGSGGKGHERIGKNLREAIRALRKAQVAADEGEYVPQRNLRFSEWADEWLAGLERPKASTIASYRSTIAYAKLAFGDVPVRRLTPGHITKLNDVLREKETRKVSDSTRAKHLRVLNACLTAAVRHGCAASNPLSRLPAQQRPRATKKESAYFEDGELAALFAQVPEGLYRTLFLMALKTGMRQGELLGLTWGDVDTLGSSIRVRHSYTAGAVGSPKTHERRTVDLTPDVVELLGAWWDAQGKPENGELVFPAETGGFIATWVLTRNVLYPAMKRAGVDRVGPTGEKRTFHSFRHSYARIALENEAQMFWLSRQLGHSSPRVTETVYGHWSRTSAKLEAAKLTGAFTV